MLHDAFLLISVAI